MDGLTLLREYRERLDSAWAALERADSSATLEDRLDNVRGAAAALAREASLQATFAGEEDR